jgi:hypothetical protein
MRTSRERKEAIKRAQELPHLTALDLAMPAMNGTNSEMADVTLITYTHLVTRLRSNRLG